MDDAAGSAMGSAAQARAALAQVIDLRLGPDLPSGGGSSVWRTPISAAHTCLDFSPWLESNSCKCMVIFLFSMEFSFPTALKQHNIAKATLYLCYSVQVKSYQTVLESDCVKLVPFQGFQLTLSSVHCLWPVAAFIPE